MGVAASANASDFSWVHSQPTDEKVTDLTPYFANEFHDAYADSVLTANKCTYRKVLIGRLASTTTPVCTHQAKGYHYGYIREVRFGEPHVYFVIGFPFDQRMYKVEGMPIYGVIDTPATSDFIYAPTVTFGVYLMVIKDLPSKLMRQLSNTGDTVYTLRSDAVQHLFRDEYGQPVLINGALGGIGVSKNGRWLVVETKRAGLVRIDLLSSEVRWFSRYIDEFSVGSSTREIAVSDNGKYVAVAGSNSPHELTEIENDCSVTATTYRSDWPDQRHDFQGCSSYRMDPAIRRHAPEQPGSPYSYKPEFSHDGAVLTVYTDYTTNGIRFTAGNYHPAKLDYLALGDSYSSGEGDTIRLPWQSVYRKGTDEAGPPVEKCHISTRSYPYLLAAKYGLQSDRWSTIACSGAQVREDYYGDDENYLGQKDRLSDIKDKDLRQSLKEEGKNNFIPGRVKQLEFIKKYQPKIITITGSGNDVNFGGVLKACVSPLSLGSDCQYAESHGTTMLGLAVEDQYYNARELVREIKVASPRTTVYYIGYPQFISGNKSCAHISGLSLKERTLFRATTTYLNRIIKAAAESEGALYVDTENVFESGKIQHTLCNPGPLYVNNFTLGCSTNEILKWLGGSLDCEESYHPNHFGHEAITDRIAAEYPDLITARPCVVVEECTKETAVEDVPVPELFLEAYADDAAANYTPVRGSDGILAVQKGNPAGAIRKSIPSQQPNTDARVYLTSEPTELGTVRSDAAGILTLDIPVPDSIAAGYHTLHVEAHSYSGEPIELWWIVLVLGKDGDIDEDGIADSADKCAFTPELGRDLDRDGIDDGCDPYVGPASQTADVSQQYRPTVYSNQSHAQSDEDSSLETRDIVATTNQRSTDKASQGDSVQPTQSIATVDKPSPTIDKWIIVFIVSVVLFIILLMLKLGRNYAQKRQI